MTLDEAATPPPDSLSRRGLLLATALAAGCTGLSTGSGGGPTALEAANIDLVTRFCRDWATRDVEKLTPYLADDLVYQMFEKRPDLVGLAEFRRELQPFLAGLARVDWEVRRSFAIGQVVINDRVDHFIAPPGGRSMHFEIVGLFVVRDGKIALWRDYRLPGTTPRMEIEPPPRA